MKRLCAPLALLYVSTIDPLAAQRVQHASRAADGNAGAGGRCQVSLEQFKAVYHAKPQDTITTEPPCKFSIANPEYHGGRPTVVQVVPHETIGISQAGFMEKIDNLKSGGGLCRTVPSLGDAAYFCYSNPMELLVLHGGTVSTVITENLPPNPAQAMATDIVKGFLELAPSASRPAAAVAAARPVARAPSGKAASPVHLADTDLKLAGLRSADMLYKIYVGDFSELSGGGDQRSAFSWLFDAYATACGKHCGPRTPSKVELTAKQCVTYRTPVNDYGVPAGPKQCVEYGRRGMGIFVDAEIAAANDQLEREQEANSYGMSIADILNAPNPLAAIQARVGAVSGNAQINTQDMERLFSQNPCASAAMRRLEENLVRFAEKKPAIVMDGHAG